MTRIPVNERRSALIRAALRVVAARGVAAATTRAIVSEAGMSLASFHYVFTSRDELMTELINNVVEHEELTIAPALDIEAGTTTLCEAIRRGLEHYLIGVEADPDREKAMFELTQYALRTPGMEPLARRQYQRYFELAQATLAEAAERAGYRWHRPLGEVARFLITCTDGLTIGWLVDRDDAAAREIIDITSSAVSRLASPIE